MPQLATHMSDIDPAFVGITRAGGLSASAAANLRRLVGPGERYPAAAVLNSIAPAPRMEWIVSGWACERRVLPDGRRQIFSFSVPGDVVLSRPVSANSRCSVVAITIIECLDVAQMLGRARDVDRPELWRAMTRALSLADERRYDTIVRLGQRSAVQRVADLLIELHDRLDQIGMTDRNGFHLPLTQEHLADALGLSLVHVNRSLKALRLKGLASFRFGRVSDLDRAGLEALCSAN
jgi:CRP-like cAMP-binding protein